MSKESVFIQWTGRPSPGLMSMGVGILRILNGLEWIFGSRDFGWY